MPEPESVKDEREVISDKRGKTDDWTKDYFKKARRFVRSSPVIDYSDNFTILESNGIYSKESFLDKDECDFLIRNWVAENPDDTSQWQNRICWSALDSNKGVIEERIVQFARQETGLNLSIMDTNIVKWNEGDEMIVHDDLGEYKEFPNRHFAAIVYLNNDYEGGELMFPEINMGIKAHAGELIVFRGGSLMHNVNKVISGTRYTLASWLTING